jgi:hypothetical protein
MMDDIDSLQKIKEKELNILEESENLVVFDQNGK